MKLSTLFMLVPAAIIAVVLALANRGAVTFTLVPYFGDESFALTMPLFLLVFVSFFLGVMLGGAVMGWRGFRRARRKRLAEREIKP